MTTLISYKIYIQYIYNSVSTILTVSIERTVGHKKLVEVSFQRFGNEILQKIVYFSLLCVPKSCYRVKRKSWEFKKIPALLTFK